jgi:hypothetical protein
MPWLNAFYSELDDVVTGGMWPVDFSTLFHAEETTHRGCGYGGYSFN